MIFVGLFSGCGIVSVNLLSDEAEFRLTVRQNFVSRLFRRREICRDLGGHMRINGNEISFEEGLVVNGQRVNLDDKVSLKGRNGCKISVEKVLDNMHCDDISADEAVRCRKELDRQLDEIERTKPEVVRLHESKSQENTK